MSSQKEADLKVEAIITLNELFKLTPDDPHIVATLKKFEWDVIKHYNLKVGEAEIVTIRGVDHMIERTTHDRLAFY